MACHQAGQAGRPQGRHHPLGEEPIRTLLDLKLAILQDLRQMQFGHTPRSGEKGRHEEHRDPRTGVHRLCRMCIGQHHRRGWRFRTRVPGWRSGRRVEHVRGSVSDFLKSAIWPMDWRDCTGLANEAHDEAHDRAQDGQMSLLMRRLPGHSPHMASVSQRNVGRVLIRGTLILVIWTKSGHNPDRKVDTREQHRHILVVLQHLGGPISSDTDAIAAVVVCLHHLGRESQGV